MKTLDAGSAAERKDQVRDDVFQDAIKLTPAECPDSIVALQIGMKLAAQLKAASEHPYHRLDNRE